MRGPQRAFAVLDLGFGDAGKGLVTDHLVRREGASWVIRFNGGAQAGHNVVTNAGRHHTFAQLGAGSFVPGVRTFLSRHVVVHPTALLVEARAFESLGEHNALGRVFLSADARILTPYHQAANRLRELARGEGRHGSCGVGVGEVVADDLACPEQTIRARDLGDPGLVARLEQIRARKREQVRGLDLPDDAGVASERAVFDHPDLALRWVERAAVLRPNVVADDEAGVAISQTECVVFEGAQGVLLDEHVGFHPYTSWSRCTADNALDLVAGWGWDTRLCRVGVSRCYAVRHGPGPMPTEEAGFGARIVEHNQANPWQGSVRYGPWDAVLARYALDALGGVDLLVLTQLDALVHLPPWRACEGYSFADGSALSHLEIPRSLEAQAELAQRLRQARPRWTEVATSESAVLSEVEAQLGRRVDAVSRGPRPVDVEHR